MLSLVAIIVIILILLLVFCIKHFDDSVYEYNNHDIELIESVTSLDRGTASERFLILTLLKLGINPHAIFHDVYIKKNDGTFAQIDLVVATRVGIIVFEVKDFSGWIFGKGNQTKWTQVLAFGEQKYRFYNPVLQNSSHIKQLRQKLKENVPFYSVIVFYGDSRLQDISFIPQNTFVTKDYMVSHVIREILELNPLANYKDKHNVVAVLKQAVNEGNNAETQNQHVEHIKDMLGTDRVFQ